MSIIHGEPAVTFYLDMDQWHVHTQIKIVLTKCINIIDKDRNIDANRDNLELYWEPRAKHSFALLIFGGWALFPCSFYI